VIDIYELKINKLQTKHNHFFCSYKIRGIVLDRISITQGRTQGVAEGALAPPSGKKFSGGGYRRIIFAQQKSFFGHVQPPPQKS